MKEKLVTFINKYHLDGLVESVKWDVSKKHISVSFVTADKSLIGFGKTKGIEMEDAKFGIFTTSDLTKLLDILDDDMEFDSYNYNDDDAITSVVFKDKTKQVKFVFADQKAISSVDALDTEPKYQLSIKIDEDFINNFIKGKNALPNAETFTIIPSKKGKSDLIIGFQNINTNTVKLKVDAEIEGEISNITFSAKSFKSVLSTNKDIKDAVLYVSEDGIAKIEFKDKENDFTYYLAANDSE
jgi:hypothetical protein